MTEIRTTVLTLGSLEVSRLDRPGPGDLSARRKPLCLLVYLLLGLPEGAFHQRSSLSALFWPESDERHARASLRQALRVVDRSLPEVLERRGRHEVRVRPGSVEVDLPGFLGAIRAQDWTRAGALYRGPFLDGVHVPGSPDFERWADQLQLECAAQYKTALRHLAAGVGSHSTEASGTRLWQELASLAPYDAEVALSLARA